jgi:hypothetical protein
MRTPPSIRAVAPVRGLAPVALAAVSNAGAGAATKGSST